MIRSSVHHRMIPRPIRALPDSRDRMIPDPVRALPLAPRILPALSSRHIPLAPRMTFCPPGAARAIFPSEPAPRDPANAGAEDLDLVPGGTRGLTPGQEPPVMRPSRGSRGGAP